MALAFYSNGLLGPIAALANRNVAASTPARALCARLEGRAFAIRVAGPPVRRPRLPARRAHSSSSSTQRLRRASPARASR